MCLKIFPFFFLAIKIRSRRDPIVVVLWLTYFFNCLGLFLLLWGRSMWGVESSGSKAIYFNCCPSLECDNYNTSQLYANLLIINSTPPSPPDCFSFTYITTGLLHETNYYILKFEVAYISINMLISYDFNIYNNNNNNKAFDTHDYVLLLVNYMCQLRDSITQHVLNHYLLG
jgi:hypothetical protein